MNLYPLKFKPIYKEKIWGGKQLKTHFNRNIPSDSTGESWEVAAHKNGTSTVDNGFLAGKTLDYLIEKWPVKMMGSAGLHMNKFPLLVKLLDASKKLSVQVHPDNEYAQSIEGETGKTEMWYILAAEPGARLIHGFKKNTDRNKIINAVKNGNLEKYLNRVPVTAGDIFFIPSGTVHGIEEGILLAEIQQNSDTTYRLYDWDRSDKNGKKRPLHIDKALTVANFNCNNENNKIKTLTYRNKNYIRSYLAACPHFIIEKINIKKEFCLNNNSKKFYILMVLNGKGRLYHGKKEYKLTSGQTFYLPASLGKINIYGQNEILLTYLPGKKKDFINALREKGFEDKQIEKLAGINIWNNLQ